MSEGFTHWRTRDGRVIAIKDMTDSHLLNSIKFMERTGQTASVKGFMAFCSLLDEAENRNLTL